MSSRLHSTVDLKIFSIKTSERKSRDNYLILGIWAECFPCRFRRKSKILFRTRRIKRRFAVIGRWKQNKWFPGSSLQRVRNWFSKKKKKNGSIEVLLCLSRDTFLFSLPRVLGRRTNLPFSLFSSSLFISALESHENTLVNEVFGYVALRDVFYCAVKENPNRLRIFCFFFFASSF